MRRDAIPAHQVNCTNCHKIPLSTWEEGHIDGDGKAEVIFGDLAVADGATPVWDGQNCLNVYCHGATLDGGDHKSPNWFETSGTAQACGACHRLTDPEGNEDADCSSCHPSSIDANNEVLPYGTHINGQIDLDNDAGEQ
jgi:predicted CxxxxCH...CXXCH cytochrome family protein